MNLSTASESCCSTFWRYDTSARANFAKVAIGLGIGILAGATIGYFSAGYLSAGIDSHSLTQDDNEAFTQLFKLFKDASGLSLDKVCKKIADFMNSTEWHTMSEYGQSLAKNMTQSLLDYANATSTCNATSAVETSYFAAAKDSIMR